MALALVAIAIAAGACDASSAGPPARPRVAPPAAALADSEIAELFARARARGAKVTAVAPSELCIRRIEDAPKYVRVGEPSRGGCKLAAVCYERDCELATGDFNRFEGQLMADLGWRDATIEQRRRLALRWLRESRFALEPGDGPFLVDDALASTLGLSAPSAAERDGMLALSYWTRETRRTRERPDDWYWLEQRLETRLDPLDGRPMGTSSREDRRVPMDEPPAFAR